MLSPYQQGGPITAHMAMQHKIAKEDGQLLFLLYRLAPSMLSGIGLFAARAATRATGKTESSTGLRLETLFRSGTARPIIEAFTAYQQDLQNIECAIWNLFAMP